MPPHTLIDVMQGELAQMANLSRSTVGTLLEAFERRHLIRRGYGQLDVTDLDALLRIISPIPGMNEARSGSNAPAVPFARPPALSNNPYP